MNRKQQILHLARSKGIIRAKDVEAMGISRNYLYRMHQQGFLNKRAAGLYSLPDMTLTERSSLAELAIRIPRGVVCLLSALNYHGITTQLPHETWLAIPRGSWRPKIIYPPVHLTYVSGNAYLFGIQEHTIDKVPVKIYSLAKTVADCFKFRNKIGLDVAIEALREAWRSRRVTMDALIEAAEIDRVSKVMLPYLETTV